MRDAPQRVAAAIVLATATLSLALPGAAQQVPEALPGAAPFAPELRKRLEWSLASRGADYLPRTANLRADGSPLYSNRLLLEASPYLQQHAHNPVNWYPWGDEAFEAARRLERPVLISIGYSTCHWCHVMEEESFDVVEVARFLNAHFIAIKVDREIRPDVDAVYMAAIHALSGRGGWPLNVWVTPDRRPFFAGTYFPPEDRQGRPGFLRVLRSIQQQYAEAPERLARIGDRLAAAIARNLEGDRVTRSGAPSWEPLEQAWAYYAQQADWTYGGLGTATKFPATLPIRLLLRYHRRTGDPKPLELATVTLERMAAGGVYDQVGGGFHRYSTDPRWLVPHFEKMLYDNALLAITYLEASQLTGRQDFAHVSRDILRYVTREMTAPAGAFYSATDADSLSPDGERHEGWFFTWTPEGITAALGSSDARVVSAYYGVNAGGNFEGRTILHTARPADDVARELEVSPDELRAIVERSRGRLYEVRQRRPKPLRDDKILAAWNGLMISAFARAGFALDEPAYVEAAARAASFILAKMRPAGRLHRVYQDGASHGPAFLEDYAFVTAGLLDLYEADGELRWLREAMELQRVLDAIYADGEHGGYFKTARGHERLLAREKPGRDAALPSGNSVTALNLLRLAEFSGDPAYLERAGRLFSAFSATLERAPMALNELLLALDYHLDATKEIIVVGPASGADPSEMLAPLRASYVPNRILAVVTEDSIEAHAALVPLVEGKVAQRGRVTAYVCEDRVCELPTSDPEVFARQIRKVKLLE
ncbi:MAG: thioredoxin domain-containing protein [Myxococcota bacterium]